MSTMFINVRYGENESALCNISCKVQHVLMHMKKMASVKANALLDLCDETGAQYVKD
jgi:hypothetical protein